MSLEQENHNFLLTPFQQKDHLGLLAALWHLSVLIDWVGYLSVKLAFSQGSVPVNQRYRLY